MTTCTEAELLYEIAVLRDKRKEARTLGDGDRALALSNEIGRLTATIHRLRQLAASSQAARERTRT